LIRSLKHAPREPHVVARADSAAGDAFCEFSINTFESFNLWTGVLKVLGQRVDKFLSNECGEKAKNDLTISSDTIW